MFGLLAGRQTGLVERHGGGARQQRDEELGQERTLPCHIHCAQLFQPPPKTAVLL